MNRALEWHYIEPNTYQEHDVILCASNPRWYLVQNCSFERAPYWHVDALAVIEQITGQDGATKYIANKLNETAVRLGEEGWDWDTLAQAMYRTEKQLSIDVGGRERYKSELLEAHNDAMSDIRTGSVSKEQFCPFIASELIEILQESLEIEVDVAYPTFVIGADLLYKHFNDIGKVQGTDTVYDRCKELAHKFLASEFNVSTRSEYDCLHDFLKETYPKEWTEELDSESISDAGVTDKL